MRIGIATTLVLAALAAGFAWGGPGDDDGDREIDLLDLETRLAQVRREVKIISFDTAMKRVPALVEREKRYAKLLAEIDDQAKRGGEGLTGLLEQGRQLKLDTLEDLNEILRLHRGEHVGLSETEVWDRLASARFEGVDYNEEWLVNIFDDLEDQVRINIEVDARIYKFDTVTFDFEKTSARAMLQIMGDSLLFDWMVRGDTLYIFRERHEILFGGEWIRKKKAAWRARKKALEAAEAEARRRALEKVGKTDGEEK